MLTKERTYQALSEYSPELETQQLILVELGQDPEADEYPDDILEQVAKVSESFGLAKQKVLESAIESPNTDSEIVRQASDVAVSLLEQEGIVGFDPRSMMLLAQSEVFKAVELANKITAIKERALTAGLQKGNQELLEKLVNGSFNADSVIEQVFSQESMAAFVADAVPAQASSLPLLEDSLNVKRKALQPAPTQKQLQPVNVDVKKFLAEQKAKVS